MYHLVSSCDCHASRSVTESTRSVSSRHRPGPRGSELDVPGQAGIAMLSAWTHSLDAIYTHTTCRHVQPWVKAVDGFTMDHSLQRVRVTVSPGVADTKHGHRAGLAAALTCISSLATRRSPDVDGHGQQQQQHRDDGSGRARVRGLPRVRFVPVGRLVPAALTRPRIDRCRVTGSATLLGVSAYFFNEVPASPDVSAIHHSRL